MLIEKGVANTCNVDHFSVVVQATNNNFEIADLIRYL